jgi:hypothetical protein
MKAIALMLRNLSRTKPLEVFSNRSMFVPLKSRLKSRGKVGLFTASCVPAFAGKTGGHVLQYFRQV